MSFTREEWSRDFLLALGNPSPDQATIDWVVGWTVHETATDTGALFNLLNTTQRAPGSTTFNNVGVQNFVSYQQGVQTNAEVLHQNFAGYAQLAHALITNDAAELAGPAPAVQQGLNTWCGGCGYGPGFEALGTQHRDDTFTYGTGPGGPTVFIPDGWKDDGVNTLTASNGVPVTDDFRLFIINFPYWPRENVPAGPQYAADPLTISDPTIGAGQRQDFEYCSLGWTASIAHAFFIGTTKEIALLKAQPPVQGEPLADAAKAALKAWLAS